MNQQPSVAQDLELLADFGSDISIIWMKLLQFSVVSINVVVGEFGFAKPSNDVQHIQRPATLRGFDFADGFEPGVTGANLGGVGWRTGGNDGDVGFGRDAVQVYVAAHPTGAARGRCQRLPLDDG